jgi:hypothetical protein
LDDHLPVIGHMVARGLGALALLLLPASMLQAQTGAAFREVFGLRVEGVAATPWYDGPAGESSGVRQEAKVSPGATVGVGATIRLGPPNARAGILLDYLYAQPSVTSTSCVSVPGRRACQSGRISGRMSVVTAGVTTDLGRFAGDRTRLEFLGGPSFDFARYGSGDAVTNMRNWGATAALGALRKLRENTELEARMTYRLARVQTDAIARRVTALGGAPIELDPTWQHGVGFAIGLRIGRLGGR